MNTPSNKQDSDLTIKKIEDQSLISNQSDRYTDLDFKPICDESYDQAITLKKNDDIDPEVYNKSLSVIHKHIECYRLKWKNLNISVKETNKPIISGLSGHLDSSKLVCIVGASGCGKTTFLNFLAGYTRSDLQVDGELFLNDRPLENLKILKRISGYVLQQDILYSELSVEETLMYQALLKLDKNADHQKAVDNVIKLMNLELIRDSFIGDG